MRFILMMFILFFSSSVMAQELFQNILHLFNKRKYVEESAPSDIFPIRRSPSEHNIFIFDPNNHAWAVYDTSGERVGLGNGSGGKDFCADIGQPCRTVEGEFTVFRTEDKDCTSKTFPIDEGGGAPMPHCMFFYKGYAIHGSKNYAGINRSHGCIRVSKKAAQWMNENYIQPGALVIVKKYIG